MRPAPREPSKQLKANSLPATKRRAASAVMVCGPHAAGCQQSHKHNRKPRKHDRKSPFRYRPHGAAKRSLTIQIRRDHAPTWSTNSERLHPIFTTIRPRTRPSMMARRGLAHLGEPDLCRHLRELSPIEVSLQALDHAACRSATGRMTESMPRSETPRRINGATEVGKSMPPASPQAATAPPYRVIDSTLASVVEPTVSMPPAKRSFANGLAGPASSLRSMMSAAPKRLSDSRTARDVRSRP